MGRVNDMTIEMRERSGGPFDCGVRTYYYGRNSDPHCYRGGCNLKGQYTEELTHQEIKEFHAGWDDAQESGFRKDYD